MPVDVILPCCHGNTKLYDSEYIQSGENFVYLMYFMRNKPLLSCVTADSPERPLVLAQFKKYIHTHTHKAYVYVNIYIHTYAYIYIQYTYNHIHACGILTSAFKPTYPRGHKIHVLTETNLLYT